MNYVKITRYRKKSPLKTKICIISDIHFSPKESSKRFNKVLKSIKKESPGYILIPGDIIDSADAVDDEKEFYRVLDWFKELSQLAKVFISRGNHDMYRRPNDDNDKRRWLLDYNELFWDKLRKISNIFVLENSGYSDERVYVFGVDLPPEYYNFEQVSFGKSTIFHPVRENKSELLHTLEKSSLDTEKSKINFFLCHSPIYMTDPDILKKLDGFDYIVSGHMHNGIVPPILNELWRGTRGILSPTRELFPLNSRRGNIDKGGKLVISGAVTTFAACAGKKRIFRGLFPIYMTVIEL